MDEAIGEFCAITSASTKDARRYIEKYKRLDAAVDAYYNDPRPAPTPSRGAGPSTTKITQLFEKYKGRPSHIHLSRMKLGADTMGGFQRQTRRRRTRRRT
jgi:hypothetical protein